MGKSKIFSGLLAFLLAAAGCLTASGRAVNYTFAHLGSEVGLSAVNVKAICQDANGFMWFGTKSGLNRYDGRTAKRYRCYDPQLHRGNDNVGALWVSPEGDIWAGTDRGVYIFDNRTERCHFLDLKTKEGLAAGDWVQTISGDNRGNVWILVPNQGLFCVNGGKMVRHTVADIRDQNEFNPTTLQVTPDGNVFAGTRSRGIYRFDEKLSRFVNTGVEEMIGKNVAVMCQRHGHNLILCSSVGNLYNYDYANNIATEIQFSGSGRVYPRSILCVDNEIWLGTQTGLYIIDTTTHSERIIKERYTDPTGLSNSAIFFLYPDREKNIWIGTLVGGVNYLQRTGFKFELFRHVAKNEGLVSNRVRGMAKDSAGNIYIGAEEEGYTIFNTTTGQMRQVNDGRAVLTICPSGGDVVVGYAGGGMERVKPSGQTSRLTGPDLDYTSIYSYLLDNTGGCWLGTDAGLYHSPTAAGELKKVEELGNVWVFDMLHDRNGKVWIATMGTGIFSYNPNTGKYKHYDYDEAHTNGLASNSISSVMEDSRGNLWFSSDRGGLSRYNPQTDKFETISIEDGLPDSVIYDLLEDADGCLWFGTNDGLVKFNPRTGAKRVFTSRDGLLGNHFNYHSAVAGDDGYFYFGTMDGLVAFDPRQSNSSDSIAPVYFTDLTLGDDMPSVDSPDSPLKESILYTSDLTLPYDFKVMSLSVASPTYSAPGSLNYSYRMLPGDSTWVPINDNKITFAGLPPGNYTLEVRADNGVTSTTRALQLHIRGPWYRTTWAIIAYVLIIIALVAAWLFWYRNNKERQLHEREKMFKLSHEKELYENKVEFFTELAHEIRTPLSLIDAPLQAMEDLNIKEPVLLRYVKVMKQNTSRLLNLTGQLLDFQKIGASKFNFTFERVDVTALVSSILERFEPTMTLNGKTLTKQIPEQSIYAEIDREAVTKILSNLFNNALKYSASRISVRLEADDKEFRVVVESDGQKISQENAVRIFEPFYQINNKADNNGVGIGLPLCRTLAHLQHGSVEVTPTDTPDTNVFVLTLPLRQTDQEVKQPDVAEPTMSEYIINEDPESAAPSPRGYSILLVEDNDQMRDFLYDQLSRDFNVETAHNGKEALQKIKEVAFDLIVTDIMMPEMDGYELCRAVKADINRSHIPVVFLTAKNDMDSKLKALQSGGEAYVEKPFSIKYFQQQIKSILENRLHERKAYLKQPFFSVDSMKLTPADKEFMDKVIANITENISDDNFSVESMADVFCMSRSSLLRKIKSLFNQSPIELIHTVKLKKAAELIHEGKYRISDVCYMVGINSPSYFSKLFFKQFGVSPKEFEKQCRQKAQAAKTEEPT